MDGWAIAGVAVAILSLGVAVWARCDARRALTQAKRSANAAEDATGINKALFEQGKVRLGLTPNPHESYWHNLTNYGTHTAFSISITAPELYLNLPPQLPETLPPGMSVPLIAAPELDKTDRRIFVKYKRNPDGPDESAVFYI